MSGMHATVMQMCGPFAHLATVALAVGLIIGVVASRLVSDHWLILAPLILVSAVELVLCIRSFKRFLREADTRGLGVHGERIMATQLAELGRDGHIIVHDLPFPNTNIDHLIIGPKGVIVVETKMRAKRLGPRSEIRVESDCIVMNDGHRDPAPIKQLRMAMSLLKDKIRVPDELLLGVIVYPEWWVHDWADRNVRVSNDKRLFTHINALPNRMSAEQVSHYFNLVKSIFDAELRASPAPD
jgi:membrane protein implicated in regulation of membrane protease activity